MLRDFGSVADPDPGSGAFLTPGSGIRGPEWVKIRIRIRDENPDHISECLETILWVKIFKFFEADPEWNKLGSGIRDGKNLNPG